MNRTWLIAHPLAVQRRVVKAIGDCVRIPLEFKHVEEILRFAADGAASGNELSLPLGWKLVRDSEALVFLTPDLRKRQRIPNDYEYELPLPGRVAVPETRTIMEALRINSESQASAHNPGNLLDAESLPARLTIRNWRPGDRFWPAHTKSPKKIKELLQERHVPLHERKLWPVAANGNQVVWLRGFNTPGKLKAKSGCDALLIREIPLTHADEVEG